MWPPGVPPQRYPEGRIDLIEFIVAGADDQLVVVYESGDILVRWDQKWALLDPLPEQMKYILSIGFRANGDLWVGTETGLSFHRLPSRLWTQWKKGQRVCATGSTRSWWQGMEWSGWVPMLALKFAIPTTP